MEAKRRPIDVGKKVKSKNVVYKELQRECQGTNCFPIVKPMLFKVRTSILKRQIVRNRSNIGKKLAEGESGKQDATRRTARRTRRGPEARDKIPRSGEGHRPCYKGAAAKLRPE